VSFRNITWQQALVLVAALAATVACYKFLGPDAAGAASVVSTILAFLMGRDPPNGPPAAGGHPALKVIAGGAAAVVLGVLLIGPAASLISCSSGLGPADYAEIGSHTSTLERCFAEGKADGGRKHYEACKADAGIE
jgi:hypothetical protein